MVPDGGSAPATAAPVAEGQTAESTQVAAEPQEQATAEKPAEKQETNEDQGALERSAEALLGQEPAAKEQEESEPAAEAEAQEETTEEKPAEGLSALATDLFPDKEFGSEQEANQAVSEHIKELREYKDKQEGATQKLAELFRGNPDLVDLIHLMNDGASMSEALPYITGEADDTGIEGAKETWKKTAAEKAKTKAEQAKALEETSKNLEVSVQNIKKFAEENNMSDQEASEFLNEVDEIMSNISRGNITGEMMNKLLKGMRHDKVVADTADTAEVKGRNEAIKEIKTKQSEKKGDGLPHPKSTATEQAEDSEKVESPADILGRNIEHVMGSRRF